MKRYRSSTWLLCGWLVSSLVGQLSFDVRADQSPPPKRCSIQSLTQGQKAACGNFVAGGIAALLAIVLLKVLWSEWKKFKHNKKQFKDAQDKILEEMGVDLKSASDEQKKDIADFIASKGRDYIVKIAEEKITAEDVARDAVAWKFDMLENDLAANIDHWPEFEGMREVDIAGRVHKGLSADFRDEIGNPWREDKNVQLEISKNYILGEVMSKGREALEGVGLEGSLFKGDTVALRDAFLKDYFSAVDMQAFLHDPLVRDPVIVWKETVRYGLFDSRLEGQISDVVLFKLFDDVPVADFVQHYFSARCSDCPALPDEVVNSSRFQKKISDLSVSERKALTEARADGSFERLRRFTFDTAADGVIDAYVQKIGEVGTEPFISATFQRKVYHTLLAEGYEQNEIDTLSRQLAKDLDTHVSGATAMLGGITQKDLLDVMNDDQRREFVKTAQGAQDDAAEKAVIDTVVRNFVIEKQKDSSDPWWGSQFATMKLEQKKNLFEITTEKHFDQATVADWIAFDRTFKGTDKLAESIQGKKLSELSEDVAQALAEGTLGQKVSWEHTMEALYDWRDEPTSSQVQEFLAALGYPEDRMPTYDKYLEYRIKKRGIREDSVERAAIDGYLKNACKGKKIGECNETTDDDLPGLLDGEQNYRAFEDPLAALNAIETRHLGDWVQEGRTADYIKDFMDKKLIDWYKNHPNEQYGGNDGRAVLEARINEPGSGKERTVAEHRDVALDRISATRDMQVEQTKLREEGGSVRSIREYVEEKLKDRAIQDGVEPSNPEERSSFRDVRVAYGQMLLNTHWQEAGLNVEGSVEIEALLGDSYIVMAAKELQKRVEQGRYQEAADAEVAREGTWAEEAAEERDVE